MVRRNVYDQMSVVYEAVLYSCRIAFFSCYYGVLKVSWNACNLAHEENLAEFSQKSLRSCSVGR